MLLDNRFLFFNPTDRLTFARERSTPISNRFCEGCRPYARMHWYQTAELIVHAFASILKINNLLHEVGAMIIFLEGFQLHIWLRERIVS